MATHGRKVLNNRTVNYLPRANRHLGTIPFTVQDGPSETGTCQCRVCLSNYQCLTRHLEHKHNLTVAEYREQYGADAPWISDELKERWRLSMIATKARSRLKACVVCGTQYSRRIGYYNRLTCSNDCNMRLRGGRVDVTCEFCGKVFTSKKALNRRFCGNACKMRDLRRRLPQLGGRSKIRASGNLPQGAVV